MLIHNPRTVRFGSTTWNDVTAIIIDRSAKRLVEEFSDLGPHITFVDVPEQRIQIRILQQPVCEGVEVPKPGDQGTLSFQLSLTGGDTGRRKLSMSAVIIAVEHDLSLPKGPTRKITLLALSETGAIDPITVT